MTGGQPGGRQGWASASSPLGTPQRPEGKHRSREVRGDMLPRDIYTNAQAVDAVLDDATVLRLVQRHVPDAVAVRSVDESGGEARTYAVDDHLILKTQRPHRLRERTSLEKEVFFLGQLADAPGIVTPRVHGYGREGGIEYICMSRMPGVPAGALALTGADRTRLLHDLGRMVWHLHAIPQQPFRQHPLFPGPRDASDFGSRLEAGFAQAIADLRGQPDLWPLAQPPEAVAAAALQTLPADVPLVALHSNPGPEHVFVDPDTRRLTGIIDFGDAFVGHPGFDWRWPLPEDRAAMLEGYRLEGGLPASFEAGWRVAQVYMEVVALATRPERRQTAVAHLQHLLG